MYFTDITLPVIDLTSRHRYIHLRTARSCLVRVVPAFLTRPPLT